MDDPAPIYNSQILHTYLQYLEARYPRIEVDRMLEHAGMTRYEVEDPSHWFTQQQTDRFHEKMNDLVRDPEISRKVGRFTIQSGTMGAIKQYVLGVIDPASIYLISEKVSNYLSRGARLRARRLGPNRVEILATPMPGVHEKPYQCQNRWGIFESAGTLFANDMAQIEHPECVHRGDAACRYLVSWSPQRSTFWRRWRNLTPPLGLLAAAVAALTRTPLTGGAVLAVSLLVFLLLALITAAHRNQELALAVEKQGDTSQVHIEELNIRYHHARLHQEIGRAVSGVMDVDRLIRQALAVLEQHLDFKGGLILLSKAAPHQLACRGSCGFEHHVQQRLEAALLTLPPRDGDLLSEAYHTRRPFLLNRLESAGDQIAPELLETLKGWGVRSLVCVPLEYREQTMGLLAMTDVRTGRGLNQSDINLLQGVASQMSVAINNALVFRQLQDNERQLSLFADNVTDVIWILNRATLQLDFISPSVTRALGYSVGEASALTLRQLLAPESYGEAARAIRDVLRNTRQGHPGPYRMELEMLHRDGRRVWMDVTISILIDSQGEVTSLLGVARDITERRQAESEKKQLQVRLQRAQKMEAIGMLAGGVAHDLNNILSGVVSYPDLLLLDMPVTSPYRRPVEIIQKSGQKAAAIVQDLLTLARRGVVTREQTQLNAMIEDYLESPEFDMLTSYHPGVVVQTRLAADLPGIEGSPVHLAKTLMNLVSNAAEAMPDGGLLVIATEHRQLEAPLAAYEDIAPGQYAVLSVSDTGVGISEEDRRRIFEPFYTKKVMGRSGTGLGMAVVWGTVRDHDGYIDLRSEEGRFTEVRLYFPVSASRPAPAPAPGTRMDVSGRGETVLVVDDVPEQREIACGLLQRLGYQAQAVSGGEAAVEFVQQQPVDLVLLDMIMDPGIDGLETYRRLCALRPGQKALIASGFSETDRVREAQRLGAGAYIKKPYLLEDLGAAIRTELLRRDTGEAAHAAPPTLAAGGSDDAEADLA
jgi:PAS domain S-box-containing protein